VIEIVQTLVQLVNIILTLLVEVGTLALRYGLVIAWIAWWLWGVNWTKAWTFLAKGGWIVVVLLDLVSALAWAAMAPSNRDLLGLFSIPNFWWQFGVVSLLVLSALFCGWLQGVLGWAPMEIELQPATESAHSPSGHH
jgi:hypothetical protein